MIRKGVNKNFFICSELYILWRNGRASPCRNEDGSMIYTYFVDFLIDVKADFIIERDIV